MCSDSADNLVMVVLYIYVLVGSFVEGLEGVEVHYRQYFRG